MSRRDIIVVCVCFHLFLLGIIFYTATPTPPSSPPLVSQLAGQPRLQEGKSPSSTALSLPQREEESLIYRPTLISDQSGDRVDTLIRPRLTLKEQESPQPLPLRQEVPAVGFRENRQLPESSPPPQLVEITVKRGDALEKIARANRTTVKEIRSLNNLTSDRLDIGQVLLVPAPSAQDGLQSSVMRSQQPMEESREEYVMKPGDNLWRVARLHGLSFEELLKINNLDEESARHLRVGNKIRIR